MIGRIGRWLIRSLVLCWSMTWRAMLVIAIGTAVGVVVIGAVTGRVLRNYVVEWLLITGVASSLFWGVPTGLGLGLITRLGFDPPAAPRRYRWLMRLLGALVCSGTLLVFASPSYWARVMQDRQELITEGLTLLVLAISGWLAGDWAARFHLQSSADEQQAGPLPRRLTVPTDEQSGIQ